MKMIRCVAVPVVLLVALCLTSAVASGQNPLPCASPAPHECIPNNVLYDDDLDGRCNEDEINRIDDDGDQNEDGTQSPSYARQCHDSVDNDGDGLTDSDDPDCKTGTWVDEDPYPPMCDWEACIGTDCSSYTLKYFRSHDLSTADPNITRAIIGIHGRNAADSDVDDRPFGYYGLIYDAADADPRGLLNSTLIITPHFSPASKDSWCGGGASSDGRLCWSSSTDEGDYPGGGNADNDGHLWTSSFYLVDEMINTLAHLKTTGVFQNLDTIVVVGHSAGGQFTLRYAMAGSAEPLGITVRYVPVNAGGMTYLNCLRPTQEAIEAFPNIGYEWDCSDPKDGINEQYPPPGAMGILANPDDWTSYPASYEFPDGSVGCVSDESYDKWPWGIADVSTPTTNDYMATKVESPAALRSQYLKRNVAIIAGIDDNLYRSSETCGGPEPVSEWNCAHALQGQTRTERSALFHQYTCLGFGCANHAFETVCIDGNGDGLCDFFNLCPDLNPVDGICDNRDFAFITIPCDDYDGNGICEKRVMHGPIHQGGNIYDSDVTHRAIFDGLKPAPAEDQWAKTLGGLKIDKAVDVEIAPGGGYIVVGETESFDPGAKDLWVVALDEAGTMLWQKTYGGSGDESAAAVTVAPDGGYLLVGTTDSTASGERDAWMVKIDAGGDVEWANSYGGALNDYGVDVVISNDSKYIVGGITSDPDTSESDIWLMKWDPSYGVVWHKTYDSSTYDRLSSLHPAMDGGFILAGETYHNSERNGDFWVLRVDKDGVVQWEKAYGLDAFVTPGETNENIERVPRVDLTHDGGYIMAGNTVPWTNKYMVWLLKLDSNGAISWEKLFSTIVDCDLSSIQQTRDGGYIVSGSRGADGDGWLMKLDQDGVKAWDHFYGGVGDQMAFVRQARDGGYIAVGATESLAASGKDLWILKLDAVGEIPDCPTVRPGALVAETDPAESPVDFSSSVTDDSFTSISWSVTVTVPPSEHVFEGDGCHPTIADLIDLPRTGQTIPYRVGDDGHIQAGVAWPSPRFIDNGDGTVTDYLTGLMWLKDANCAHSAAYDPNSTGNGLVTWERALDFVAGINDGTIDISLCSGYSQTYDDWRLANVNEMESLIHSGVTSRTAWLNSQGIDNVQNSTYWTSTPCAGIIYHHSVYVARFQSGRIDDSDQRTTHYSWPVRAGQSGYPDPVFPANVWRTGKTGSRYPGDDGDVRAGVVWPSSRFTDHGDGTVTDNLTGLMWLQDAACLEVIQWHTAVDRVDDFKVTPGSYACANYTANHGDWRLPNRKELRSLVNHQLDEPALPDGHPFIGLNRATPQNRFWTSNTELTATRNAWTVQIGGGASITEPPLKTSRSSVLPVRGGIHGVAVRNTDFDGDGDVDGRDLAALAIAFGSHRGDTNFDPRVEIVVNEAIDQADLEAFTPHLGRTDCPCM